jgi:septal ring factor EnvC (AmiA/AmiB activator)
MVKSNAVAVANPARTEVKPMSEFNTQPTIQTLLEEMQKGFAAVAEQFNEVFRRLDMIEMKIDRLNNRLLNLEAEVGLHEKRISDLENHV